MPSADNSKQFTDATTELCLSLSSENAVAIIDKKLQLYMCLQILSVSIFEKTQISCALQPTISNSTCAATLTSSFCSISNRTLVILSRYLPAFHHLNAPRGMHWMRNR
jgi:hypothetical protein